MKPDLATVVGIRAIDVGHFSTKYSLGRRAVGNDQYIAAGMFPSLAPTVVSDGNSSGTMLNTADGCIVRVDGADFFVGRDSASYSSGGESREVLGHFSSTAKYMALLRGALHYIAVDANAPNELVIECLVLGLPLTTFATERKKLAARVKGEHLLPVVGQPGATRRVTIRNVTVVVQPQGALVYHGASKGPGKADDTTLVVDSGGGTLDWFVVEGRLPNWQRSGAHPKSMLACAFAVSDRIDIAWRDNYKNISRIDTALRMKAESFKAGGDEFRMADFSSAVDAVLLESTEKMIAKIHTLDDIDSILFTGGGAQVFKEFLAKRYPRKVKIMSVDDEPVYSNCKGFQIIGEMLQASGGR